ncbi:alpha/beta fold hydrolase [Fibrella arboris]|uniref:alpha/beta fold hydrolase n=1 Tax=Fibrella arboris TaxID=3242486 RepID=UPI00351FAAFF
MLTTLTRTPPHTTKPALVFLHFFGGSIQSWNAVLDQLAEEFYCLTIDLPGFGESPALTEHQSVDDVSNEVAAVITAQLGTRPFLLIGHSMGGKIALALAAGTLADYRSTGLRGMVLLAPSPPGAEPITNKDRQEMLEQPSLPPDEQRKAAGKTVANITNLPLSDTIRQQLIADNLRSSPQGWSAWLTTGSLNDITDRMGRIDVPVTILAGDHDNALPHSVQSTMVQPYLPQATIEIISGAGHLLPLETPTAVSRAIRNLSDRVH